MKITRTRFLQAFVLTLILNMTSSFAALAQEEAKEDFIVPVFSTKVLRGTLSEMLRSTGTVFSQNSVNVSSKATGIVVTIYHDEGDRVNAGDVLLKIDDEKISLRLKQANEGVNAAQEIYKKTESAIKLEEEQITLSINLATSNLESAKALYEKAQKGARDEEKKQAKAAMLSAEAAFKNAEANYKRMEELYKKKTVSAQQFDLEKMQYDVAKAQYDIARENHNLLEAGLRDEDIKAAKANYDSAVTSLEIAESLKLKLDILKNDLKAALSNLKQAEYERNITKIMFDDTLVHAPIFGVISKKYIDEGEMIQAPGIPLFTILDQKSVKVKVNIPETQIAKIKKGLTTVVVADSHPKTPFIGTVSKLGETIDLRLRTMETEISIPNDNGLLKEGMFARVAIHTTVKKDVVYVPKSAVLEENGSAYVFTVEGDRPVKNEVTVGISEGNRVEIISGIAEGDEVIYRGNARLKEDMKIRIEEE